MKWKTIISTIKDDKTIIRDKYLIDLAEQNSFVKNIYFIITGKEATKEIEKILNVLFSLSLDHGLGVVSTLAARFSTSAGATLQQSLIAALSSMGHLHGGTVEDAAYWYSKSVKDGVSPAEAVGKLLENNQKIPGYGHFVLKHDERANMLLNQAKKLNLFGSHCQFAQEAEKAIAEIKHKDIPLNIDGAIAAVCLDIGLPAETSTALFIIGRLPGLIAHIKEEKEQNNNLRRLPEDSEDIEYLGLK